MKLAGVLLGWLCLLSGPLLAQTEGVADTVSVNYVMVPFTVLGPKGVPLATLSEKDVTLFVDDVQVSTDLFEKSMKAPVSFAILLDGSGSMALAGKMDSARAAVRAMIASKRPGDEFSLYVFDDRETIEVVPYTPDANKILSELDGIRPYGKTAFFDAVATMPARSELGTNPTRAIILLSDGIDNSSRLTRLQLAAKLEGVSVPIFPLALRPYRSPEAQRAPSGRVAEELSDTELLEEIAAETGGKMFLGTKPEHFAQAVAGLDQALRAQYLIGFPPTGKGVVKYRRISLKVAGRDRSVRVRAGYKGTEPPLLTASRARTKSKRSERKGSQ